jgi:hypothetical protein
MKTCDSASTQKECFAIGEAIYLQGKEFNVADGTYPIYVVLDVEEWYEGMTIPSRVSGSTTTVNIVNGRFGPTAILTGSTNEEYDVVLDVDNDGYYDIGDIGVQGDALDNDDVAHTAGFLVGAEQYRMASVTATGTQREVYALGEAVYVSGEDFSVADGTYPIYLVRDVETWTDNMEIPDRVDGSTMTVDIVDGSFGPTLLWVASEAGKFDIVLDINDDGHWNNDDALDNDDVVSSPGLIVTPEYAVGSLAALLTCFTALIVGTKMIRKTPQAIAKT